MVAAPTAGPVQSKAMPAKNKLLLEAIDGSVGISKGLKSNKKSVFSIEDAAGKAAKQLAASALPDANVKLEKNAQFKPQNKGLQTQDVIVSLISANPLSTPKSAQKTINTKTSLKISNEAKLTPNQIVTPKENAVEKAAAAKEQPLIYAAIKSKSIKTEQIQKTKAQNPENPLKNLKVVDSELLTAKNSNGKDVKLQPVVEVPASAQTVISNRKEIQSQKQAQKIEKPKNKIQQLNSKLNGDEEIQKGISYIDKIQILQASEQSSTNSQTNPVRNSESLAQNLTSSNTAAQIDLDKPLPETAKNSQPIRTTINLGEQIQDTARLFIHSNKNQLMVRLNPPELGSIFLKVSDKDGEISGLLKVSNLQAQSEIQQQLPEILRNLEEAGINIKRFDCIVDDSANQQTDQQSLQQQNSQSNIFSNDNRNGYPAFHFTVDQQYYPAPIETIQSPPGDDSLNILM